MKTKKIVLTLLALVVVAVVVVLFATIGSLDKIIEAGIEKYGSEMTAAEITLEEVTLDLSNGQASLRGLLVGNPEGFETEYLTSLDEINVILDLDSITTDPVVIKEINIQNPVFIYEMGVGGNNLDAILNNVKEYVGAREESDEADGKSAGPKLIIDNVYIRDGTVSVSHKALKGKKMLTAPLPEIHIKDIGREEGGATPGEVAEKIISSVRSGATSAVATLNLDKVKQAGGAIKESLGKAGEKLKGLFK